MLSVLMMAVLTNSTLHHILFIKNIDLLCDSHEYSIIDFVFKTLLSFQLVNVSYEMFTQVILVVGLNFCSQTQVLCLPFTLKLSSVWNYKLTIHTFIHMYTSDVRQQICSKTDVSLISRMMIPGYTNRKCKLLPAWATQEESC